MALAFDAVSSVNQANLGTGLVTLSHTCTGSNRLLMVGIAIQGTETVTSVVYGAQAMTLAKTESSNSQRIYLYYLIAPATGANNIVVTMSGNQDATVGGISLTGADQTSPIGASSSNAGSGLFSISTTFNTTFANSMVVDMVAWMGSWGGGQTIEVQADQTRRYRFGTTSIPVGGMGGSTKTTTTAGSYTLGWDRSAGNGYAHQVVVECKEVQPVITRRSLSLLGVS